MIRRDFFRALGAAGTVAVTAASAEATETGAVAGTNDPVGVLVDTTKCLGCRMCEFACATANGLPKPDINEEATPSRDTTPKRWTAVRRYQVGDRTVSVKRQCFHCLQPACTSACLTKAMVKNPDGPVTWRSGKCMGCRYCMVSCPFDVPRFEYDSAVPRIQKCQLCISRVTAGESPACVAHCPGQALTFGRRENLLDEARSRIYTNPDRYVHQIYGEHEVGGTSWLYLSAVPFDQIGFRTDLGTTAFPSYTKDFLYAVPLVLTLVPPFLLSLAKATDTKDETDDEGGAS